MSDDFDAAAQIKSVSLRGRTSPSFSNSMIAASEVGRVSLGNIATARAVRSADAAAGRSAVVISSSAAK